MCQIKQIQENCNEQNCARGKNTIGARVKTLSYLIGPALEECEIRVQIGCYFGPCGPGRRDREREEEKIGMVERKHEGGMPTGTWSDSRQLLPSASESFCFCVQ